MLARRMVANVPIFLDGNAEKSNKEENTRRGRLTIVAIEKKEGLRMHQQKSNELTRRRHPLV